MKNDVIIACDFKNKEELFEFLHPFKGLNPFLKIGMEIFYKEGPELVRELKGEILRQGKIPFYGTSESHSISQTVGLKAGFVPAWTEVYVREIDS